MVIDIWGFESTLYPLIDVDKFRRCCKLDKKFDIGDGQKIQVKIINHNKEPLDLRKSFDIENSKISINFWKNKKPWFRIDNDVPLEIDTFSGNYKGNFLHFHLETPNQKFEEHVPIPSLINLAELISLAFENARKILLQKFPESIIQDSKGATGSLSLTD
jgi:hypothetical protein